MAKKTPKKVAKKSPKKTAKAPAKRGARNPSSQASDVMAGAGPMHLPLLEKLTSLMAEHDLSNLELQDGYQTIKLSRGSTAPVQIAAAAPVATPAPAATTPPPVSAPSSEADTSGGDTSGLVEIKSPMVGTFYSSPSPDAKAFVSVGSKVGPDTDVCLIEAMKVFNNIKAETSGTIEKLLVENGDAVEFGQALFLVKP
ncbi:MAG: acetyl-CoA carboxylase biotin carboxyl carrier protein [Planctomycetota bacterium]